MLLRKLSAGRCRDLKTLVSDQSDTIAYCWMVL